MINYRCRHDFFMVEDSLDAWVKGCGFRLRVIREALGYESLREFAAITGVTEDALSAWERGQNRVQADYIERLRVRFKVSHDWIFGGELSGLPRALSEHVERVLGRESLSSQPGKPVSR